MVLYLPQLNSILIYQQVIHTQEVNTVFFGFYESWNQGNFYWTLEVWTNKLGWGKVPHIIQLTIILNHRSNFPIFQFYLNRSEYQAHQALETSLGDANQENLHINVGEKDLLRLQFQLVHIVFGHIKCLDHNGKLPVNNSAALVRVWNFFCAACQFGKQSKRPDGSSKTHTRY